MLVLSAEDISHSADLSTWVDAMEEAFLVADKGDYLMPDRMHVNTNGNTLLLMPCFAGADFCTKLVSVFPQNKKRQLPSIQGAVMLNNGETGEPVALLNGPKLTAMRTAAVGSVGVRYLSPEQADTLGIIGTGVQGLHQTLFACSQRPIKKVYLFQRDQHPLETFIDEISRLVSNVEFYPLNSIERLLDNSRIVITATSSSAPVLPDDHNLLHNKCVIGIGSFKPEMTEFAPALYRLLEQIFVDTEFACKESGDLLLPLQQGWIKKDQVHSMSELVAGKINPDRAQTTCFKSVGMALFDLVAARLVYEKALQKGLGTQIRL